jgi:hypothetical protein
MPAGKQPNTVVFSRDNFGWGELSCYGGGAPTVVASVGVARVGPRLIRRPQRGERPHGRSRECCKCGLTGHER